MGAAAGELAARRALRCARPGMRHRKSGPARHRAGSPRHRRRPVAAHGRAGAGQARRDGCRGAGRGCGPTAGRKAAVRRDHGPSCGVAAARPRGGPAPLVRTAAARRTAADDRRGVGRGGSLRRAADRSPCPAHRAHPSRAALRRPGPVGQARRRRPLRPAGARRTAAPAHRDRRCASDPPSRPRRPARPPPYGIRGRAVQRPVRTRGGRRGRPRGDDPRGRRGDRCRTGPGRAAGRPGHAAPRPRRRPRTGWFFEAEYDPARPPYNREPEKCSGLAWFPLDALPDDIVAYCRAGLDGYRAGSAS